MIIRISVNGSDLWLLQLMLSGNHLHDIGREFMRIQNAPSEFEFGCDEIWKGGER
jgi:hypothetical protein